MITRLKISRSATSLIATKYKGLKHNLTPNLILRNALTFSMKNGEKYNGEKIDNGGTEFQISTLLGSNSEIFFMLICEHYNKKLNDEDMKSAISFHIENGLKNKEFIKLF